jgi:hypothetical protein
MFNCFTEEMPVYSQNQMKPAHTLQGQNAKSVIIKAGDTYSYHWAL